MAHWHSELCAEGRALGEAGRQGELLELLEPAFEIDDLDMEELETLEHNYAWTLLHVGRADDAVALASDLLDRVAALGRARPDTTNVLGMALVAAGQPREALELLDDQLATAVAADRRTLSAHRSSPATRSTRSSGSTKPPTPGAMRCTQIPLASTERAPWLDSTTSRGTPCRSGG